MKKILILGSNSFAGSCFINFLLTKNQKVIGISRSNQSKLSKYRDNKKIKNFTFFKLDINKDLKKIEKIISKYKFEFVIDFLGQGMVAESWNHPDHWFKTNLFSKVKLLKFLENKKYLKKYIRISTPEIYGSCKKKLTEQSKLNPSTPYALTHATIDNYLNLMYQKSNFPKVILRFSNFYGETQQLYIVIPKTKVSTMLRNFKL